eukprot:tig00001098_g7063.t1
MPPAPPSKLVNSPRVPELPARQASWKPPPPPGPPPRKPPPPPGAPPPKQSSFALPAAPRVQAREPTKATAAPDEIMDDDESTWGTTTSPRGERSETLRAEDMRLAALFERAIEEGKCIYMASEAEIREFYRLMELGQSAVSNDEARRQAQRECIGLVNVLKKKYMNDENLKNSLVKIDPKASDPMRQTLALRIPGILGTDKDLIEEFLTEAYEAKSLYYKMSIEEKLSAYGLYKQAVEGDCNVPKPSMMKYSRRMKWDAWDSQRGTQRLAAMKKCIAHIRDMKDKYAWVPGQYVQ